MRSFCPSREWKSCTIVSSRTILYLGVPRLFFCFLYAYFACTLSCTQEIIFRGHWMRFFLARHTSTWCFVAIQSKLNFGLSNVLFVAKVISPPPLHVMNFVDLQLWRNDLLASRLWRWQWRYTGGRPCCLWQASVASSHYFFYSCLWFLALAF